jgi:hypothetical protein
VLVNICQREFFFLVCGNALLIVPYSRSVIVANVCLSEAAKRNVMSKYIRKALLSAFMVVSITSLALGQQAPRGASEALRTGSGKLRLRKLVGLGNKGRIFTPSYTTDVGRGIERSKEWRSVLLTYDTAPEWIDEMLIQFYVLGMTRDPETKRNVYSLYKMAVWYLDIAEGRNHMATVYLRPAALERYGEPVAVAAVVTLDGEVVAEISDESTKLLPADWCNNAKVTDSQATTTRDGYLLDRSKSPWALINPDDYEVIK